MLNLSHFETTHENSRIEFWIWLMKSEFQSHAVRSQAAQPAAINS
jgi:hypothetical protein